MDDVKEDPRFKLEIVKWEGKLHCCYLNDFRIAGGKPWGGGQFVKSWSVPLKDVISAIPELRALKSDLDAQRLRADTAEAELSLTEKEVEGLQSALGDAEQRIAELAELLREVTESLWQEDDSGDLFERIDAALNPNPEAESHE